MKLKKTLFVLICIFSGFSLFPACASNVKLQPAYEQAVRDASIAEKSEIAEDLIAIKIDNTELVWNADKSKILVVTWKSRESFEQHLKGSSQTSTDEAHVIWVTAVPQVKEFCRKYTRNNPDASEADTNMRLKQYLGLNPTWQYDVFVELWVSPDDMFRPCVDPEISDSTCNLEFEGPAPTVKGIQDYPGFYKDLYYSRFRTNPGVPWTGLGYTFDWGNPLTEQGASEFILVPGAAYEINRVIPTMDYGKIEDK